MRLLCLGDVALADEQTGDRIWESPFSSGLSGNQRILFNWELPIGDKVISTPRICGGPRLVAVPGSPRVIQNWAPGYAALANNHILDAGEEGLVRTIHDLQEIRFVPFGAGIMEEKIKEPVVWETEEGTLAILNWVFPETDPDQMTISGPNGWPGIDSARKIIHDLKSRVDWIVVYVHWSDELFPYPRPEDRCIAQELAKTEMDVLIGSHSHVVRGMELINSRPIFYCLGEYYFSEFWEEGRFIKSVPRNRESLGIVLSFERGKKVTWNAIPYWKNGDEVLVDPRNRALGRMKRVSASFGKKNYPDWYRRQRKLFDILGSRWHFGIMRLGFRGTLLRIGRKTKELCKPLRAN